MSDDRDPRYWRIAAELGFENGLDRLMRLRGLGEAEVAKRAGVGVSFVRRALQGDVDGLPLEHMVLLARAVGGILQISIIAEEDEVAWVLTRTEAARLLDERERLYGSDAVCNADPPTALERVARPTVEPADAAPSRRPERER